MSPPGVGLALLPSGLGRGAFRPRRRDGRRPSRRPGGPAPKPWQRRPSRSPVTPGGPSDPNRERCRSGVVPGVRGGAALRQSPQGTHGVWPQGVSWLVSHNHADPCLICMTGSRGRPGLWSARSYPAKQAGADEWILHLASRTGCLNVPGPPGTRLAFAGRPGLRIPTAPPPQSSPAASPRPCSAGCSHTPCRRQYPLARESCAHRSPRRWRPHRTRA